MHKPHHLTRYTDEPREPQESADPRRWKALAVLSLAQLMLILDLTVVNVALPNLGADLDLSRTAFTWAVSAYTLFFGGLLLIGGRVGQGVGAALLSPAALSAITGIFHGEERNKALSVWASIGGIGFATGLLIGGILTTGPGWRWVFFINVPVGIVLLAAIRAVVPSHRPDAPPSASTCWAR